MSVIVGILCAACLHSVRCVLLMRQKLLWCSYMPLSLWLYGICLSEYDDARLYCHDNTQCFLALSACVCVCVDARALLLCFKLHAARLSLTFCFLLSAVWNKVHKQCRESKRERDQISFSKICLGLMGLWVWGIAARRPIEIEIYINREK